MRLGIAAAACLAATVLAACAPGEDPDTPGEETNSVQEDPAAGGEDDPVAADDQGSAELPTLPIGGDVEITAPDTSTCAYLAWSGEELPGGVVVRISELGLPSGVEVEDASCDGPPCLGGDSFSAEQQNCAVAFRWDGTPSGEEELTISASGEVSCELQEICEEVRSLAEAGGTASLVLPEPSESEETSEWTDSPEPEDETGEESEAPEPEESTDPALDPTGESS